MKFPLKLPRQVALLQGSQEKEEQTALATTLNADSSLRRPTD